MKFKAVLILILLMSVRAYAADYTGKVIDDNDSSPLFGATVQLFNSEQKSVYHDKSSRVGSFVFQGVKSGKYTLKITYIGYDPIEKSMTFSASTKANLGTFRMKISETKTKEVIVQAQMPIGEMKEDTASFNANAYKVAEGAVAEDIVKKMPGVEVQSDGTIKAQGEQVKTVLVDGKPFFGSDPQTAMKNLPADVIDQIQVFDKVSDNAQFTGNSDAETEKAINIITKRDKRQGQFGRVTAGYGSEGHYSGDLFWNFMNDASRLSIIGLINDINKQNFSFDDIIGAAGGSTNGKRPPQGGLKMNNSNSELRPGGGGGFNSVSSFLVNQSDGLVNTKSIGANYSNQLWGEKVDLSGSYFFNKSDNTNTQVTDRNYFLDGDSLQLYNQIGTGSSNNYNHRFNARVQVDFDSSNAVMIQPSLNAQSNNMNTYAATINQYQDSSLINKSTNKYFSDYSGKSFSNDITYRHFFDKNNSWTSNGRMFSLSFDNSYQDKDGYAKQHSITDYYTLDETDTLQQKSDIFNKSVELGGEVRYREPLTKNSSLNIEYNFDNTDSRSNKTVNALDEALNTYSVFDTTQSNTYKSLFTTHTAGISYRYSKGIFNMSSGVDYQYSKLTGTQYFPYSSKVDYDMSSWLPNLRMNLRFDKQKRAMLRYRTKIISPTVTQLQEVLDNSNPLQLTIGNSNLKPQYSNTVMANYMNMSKDMTKMFMIFGSVNMRDKYITNSYYTATKDTVLNSVALAAGSQLIRPINVNGFFDSRLFMNYGFPFKLISSNMNFGFGGTYTHTPTNVNGINSKSNAWAVNGNVNIGSNISENLDYNINAGYTYNITKNSITSSNSNNKYNVYNVNLELNWTVLWGIYIQISSTNTFYNGAYYDNGDYNINLLNIGLGKKFLKGNAAEVKLYVYDALNKNKNVSNNMTEYYTEFVSSTLLKRYVMLSFTYNLRQFGSSSKKSDDGMPGPPPGGPDR